MFTDAKIMGNPAKPVPAAETIPSAIDRLIGLVENGMKRHPSNDKRIPVERVRCASLAFRSGTAQTYDGFHNRHYYLVSDDV